MNALRRRRWASPLETRCVPSFNDSLRSVREDCQAGARPKRMPVTREAARAKRKTRKSISTISMRGMLPALNRTTSLVPQSASSVPATPPRSDRTRLSQSNWRTNPPATRAERGAHCHLPLPRQRSREQQVGDVGASDEQDERDSSRKIISEARVAHDGVEQRLQPDLRPNGPLDHCRFCSSGCADSA